MRKMIITILIMAMLSLSITACGNKKMIDGVTYDTCGIFNKLNDETPKDIKYKIIVGNVIWGIILCETIIAPVYFFGFSMYEPVGKKEIKDGNKVKVPKM